MPLLVGPQADSVRAALAELSARFSRLRAASLPGASLAGGQAGLALVHDGLERAFPGSGHGRRRDRAIDRAITAVGEMLLEPGLHDGFTGVAWAVEHLVGHARGPDEVDLCASIDDVLARYLARQRSRTMFDVVEGLAGFGVYGLERASVRIVARVVDLLAASAQTREEGLAWRSRADWFPREFRASEHKDWNLGLAHGTPGVIALLGAVCVARSTPEATRRKARETIGRAVPWLLAQELSAARGGGFPYSAGATTPARLAWCYGDLGVAHALLAASRALNEPSWHREALRIAVATTHRPADAAGTFDCGLCHGTAGIGHLYHRMYTLTGDERLAEAARGWFATTLDARRKGHGFAGYAAFGPHPVTGRPGWHADAGFLVGAAGVTLALLSALGYDDGTWDRPLLTALRW